jgi:hypothetical protein
VVTPAITGPDVPSLFVMLLTFITDILLIFFSYLW